MHCIPNSCINSCSKQRTRCMLRMRWPELGPWRESEWTFANICMRQIHTRLKLSFNEPISLCSLWLANKPNKRINLGRTVHEQLFIIMSGVWRTWSWANWNRQGWNWQGCMPAPQDSSMCRAWSSPRVCSPCLAWTLKSPLCTWRARRIEMCTIKSSSRTDGCCLANWCEFLVLASSTGEIQQWHP